MKLCSCLLALLLGCSVSAEIIHEVVEEQTSVYLRCPHSVEGTVTWSRENNGREVKILTADVDRDIRHFKDPQRRYSSLSDKSLSIRRVTASDSGRYFCNREAVELTVIPPGTTTRDATEGTEVTLTCPPDAGGPFNKRWSSNNTGDINTQTGFYVSPVDQMLTITSVELKHSGLYFCEGKPAAYLKVTKGYTTTTTSRTNEDTTTTTTTTTTPTRQTTHLTNEDTTTTKKKRDKKDKKNKKSYTTTTTTPPTTRQTTTTVPSTTRPTNEGMMTTKKQGDNNKDNKNNTSNTTTTTTPPTTRQTTTTVPSTTRPTNEGMMTTKKQGDNNKDNKNNTSNTTTTTTPSTTRQTTTTVPSTTRPTNEEGKTTTTTTTTRQTTPSTPRLTNEDTTTQRGYTKTTTTTTPPTTRQTTTTVPSTTRPTNEVPDLVIGIVAFLLLLIIIIVVYFALRRRIKRRGSAERSPVYDEIRDSSAVPPTNGGGSLAGPTAIYCMADDFPDVLHHNDHTYSTIPDLPPVGKKSETSLPDNSTCSFIGNPFIGEINNGPSQLPDNIYFLLEKPKAPGNNTDQHL
ncbi:cell wall integrity and stress response component 3-like isoform X2 [Cyclopterus lumpus]|uniref:cell wall integrity and stress response component 3-like isoform X2 n=1 Tax=Cyclopterus lumpus TaxID=8103 RepID=UPI001486A94F|nr:cell wall integrity and stress response component 3-like isoform X2 [Cyclopterus lumpus]